jgi:hypothetical protein
MGLHSPFGYVGYEWQMPKLACDILELLCQPCHTNQDYEKGCHGCPAGTLFFACKEYVLESAEEDKHFAKYASEEWQNKRGKHRDSPEGIAQWRRMSEHYKPESIAIRKLKRLFKKLEPNPYMQDRGHPNKVDFIKHREAIETIKTLQEKDWDLIREAFKKREAI